MDACLFATSIGYVGQAIVRFEDIEKFNIFVTDYRMIGRCINNCNVFIFKVRYNIIRDDQWFDRTDDILYGDGVFYVEFDIF